MGSYQDYKIISLLGTGSFGAVYKAEKNGKVYAIKSIRTDILQTSAKARLDVEIEAIQKIEHPNVVKLYEHGKYTENAFEYVYLVMDLIDGKTLTASIGNIDEVAAIKLTKSILETISSIHESGVLHRDLKPENIMVKPDGTPVILDLGLAKLVDYTSITQTGERLGTYYYMSPEQITDSKHIDERSDYFAIGVILYQLVTGVLPYDATNLPSLVDQIKNTYPKNPTQLNPALSNDFENVLLKMLEKDPFRRYQTTQDIINALENKPPETKRKLDLTPRFYMRMNHNDKNLILDAHKEGIVNNVIYPACYFRKNHPTVAALKKLPGLVFATDPATNRLSYSSFSKTKGVLELPYSSGSPVTPISLDDFISLTQVQDFVKKVLDYQVANGVNELCAPFFYARTPNDPWYEINIKLLKESIAYRNSNHVDLPMWAGICMNVDGWYDKNEKNRILNDYARIEADGYMVYGDPIGKPSNLTQLYHYADLLLTLQESSKAPVMASRVNGIGLILIAFGLSGISAGAASLDSFREEILSDTSEGYTNDPRYYIPELLSMISLPKSTDTKIKAIQATSLASELRCNCKYCDSINSGAVVHALVKKHYLYRRTKEIADIIKLGEVERKEYISKRISKAIDYENTLKRENVKLSDMSELTTLRDLVVELMKR